MSFIDDSMKSAKIIINPDKKYRTCTREFQGIPGIEITSQGRLWASWYAGGENEGPQNFSILVTSADNGTNWSEPIAVIDPPGNIRSFDPVLWHDPAGRLWWFWSQSYSPEVGQIFDGRGGVWCVVAENSNVEKPVFSKPRRIADGVMMNKPTVLSDGTWALPTAVWECFGPKLTKMGKVRFSNMTVSHDNGQNFSLLGSADIPNRAYDENMIVELQDGQLWMLVRTIYGIGQSFSVNKGKSWLPGENSQLGGSDSRFFIRRLQSGKLLLVNHAPNPENGKYSRNNLTAFLSDDDGKNWSGGLMLDERAGVSYPDGVQDKDGNIWIIYDHERYRHGNILFARFTEEDIATGKCVSSTASLKNLINSTGGIKNQANRNQTNVMPIKE